MLKHGLYLKPCVDKRVVIAIALMIVSVVVCGSLVYVYLCSTHAKIKHVTMRKPKLLPKVVKTLKTCNITWPNVTVRYARLFRILYTGKYYLIVKDAENHTFILVPNGCPIPKNVSGYVVHVPVSRVVYFSTTEVALLYRLAMYLHNITMLRTIVGVTWRGVWWVPYIQNLVSNGTIKYVGSSWHPNIEEIVSLNPQLVVMYTGIPTMVQVMYKLEKSGLEVFVDNEWLEHTYLARFEWIKAIAALYGPKVLNASKYIFLKVEHMLDRVYRECRNTSRVTYAWLVMYWGKFYLPGTESYVVKALRKMNGIYVFYSKGSKRIGAITANREFVDSRIVNADVIVISGFPPYTSSINPYLKALPDLSRSPALKTFRIFVLHPSYWQLGYAFTGKVILQLASILHPEEFKGVYRTFFIPIYYNNKVMEVNDVTIIWRGYYEVIKDYFGNKILVIPWGMLRQLKYYNPRIFTVLEQLKKDYATCNSTIQTPVDRVVAYYTCVKYIHMLGFDSSIINVLRSDNININEIVKMKPQVVILDSRYVSTGIVKKLENYRIPVIVLNCGIRSSGFIISLLYNYPDLGYRLFLSK